MRKAARAAPRPLLLGAHINGNQSQAKSDLRRSQSYGMRCGSHGPDQVMGQSDNLRRQLVNRKGFPA